MKTRLDTLRLFDFWRGRLSQEETREIREELEISPELKKQFDADSQLFSELRGLSQQTYPAPGDFSQNVLRMARKLNAEIDEQFSLTRVLGYSAACSAVLGAALFVIFLSPEYGQLTLGTASGIQTIPAENRLSPETYSLVLQYLRGIYGELLILALALAGLVALGKRRQEAAIILCCLSWILLFIRIFCTL